MMAQDTVSLAMNDPERASAAADASAASALALLGYWRFDDDAVPGLDDSTLVNTALLLGGAFQAGGVADLSDGDGHDRDYVEIASLPEYEITTGRIEILFTVNALDGTGSGGRVLDPSLQALFSRDSGGFNGGGHLTAWVDGDGSLLLRHQTESQDYVIQTAAGVVTPGVAMRLVYAFDSVEGMRLYVEQGADLALIGANSDPVSNGDPVSLAGNQEPWTLGASQVSSDDGVANKLRSFLDGTVDSFRIDGDAAPGVETTLYQPFQLDPIEMDVTRGEQMALLTPTSNRDRYDPVILEQIVEALDKGWDFYLEITGREPDFDPRYTIDGLGTAAVVPSSCGLGCAYFGHTGIEFWETPGFNESVHDTVRDVGLFPHYPFYEISRNFWFYGDQLHALSPAFGTSGYAVINRYIAMEDKGIGGIELYQRDPSGALYDFEEFRTLWLDEAYGDYYLNDDWNWSEIVIPNSPIGTYANVAETGEHIAAGLINSVYENFGKDAYVAFWRNVGEAPATGDPWVSTQILLDAAAEATGVDHDFALKAGGETFWIGTSAEDALVLDDGPGRVAMGMRGDDEIDGGDGDDLIFGGRGVDGLRGGEGADILVGGVGDDVLDGEAGDDSLYGGAGGDVFVLTNEAGDDAMPDFDLAEGDRLDVSALSDAGGAPVDTDDVTVTENPDGTKTIRFPSGASATVPAGTIDLSSPAARFASLVAMGVPAGEEPYSVIGQWLFDSGLDATLYSADQTFDQLLRIDALTGEASIIGPLAGFPTVGALDFDRSGVLFGVDVFRDVLLTIDPETGAGTAIGPLGAATVGGLAFAEDDTLYGADAGTGQLVTIDAATGDTVFIGEFGLEDEVQGLSFSPDGVLFGVTLDAAGGSSELVTIDTSTGAATVIGALGAPYVTGLAFAANGALYATRSTGPDEFYSVDPATGAATLVSVLDVGMDVWPGSLAAPPDVEPGADVSGLDNTALFKSGAFEAGGVADLSDGDGGDRDYVEIASRPAYEVSDGRIEIVFTVNALDGTDSGVHVLDPSLQTLFSRDSSGFDGGGHLTAWVDGDGSLLLRHQTETRDYVIATEAGLVAAGEEARMVYAFDESQGMRLYLEVDGELVEVGANGAPVANGDPVSLLGNHEPWTLGASQVASGDGVADNLRNFLDGVVDSFELAARGIEPLAPEAVLFEPDPTPDETDLLI